MTLRRKSCETGKRWLCLHPRRMLPRHVDESCSCVCVYVENRKRSLPRPKRPTFPTVPQQSYCNLRSASFLVESFHLTRGSCCVILLSGFWMSLTEFDVTKAVL